MAHRGWLRQPPLDKCAVERIRLVEHGEVSSVVQQDDVGIGKKLAEPHPSALPGLKGIVASPQEEGGRLNTSQSWCDCGCMAVVKRGEMSVELAAAPWIGDLRVEEEATKNVRGLEEGGIRG